MYMFNSNWKQRKVNRILSRRVERRGHLVTDCFPYPHTDPLSRSIAFPKDIMLIHVMFFLERFMLGFQLAPTIFYPSLLLYH